MVKKTKIVKPSQDIGGTSIIYVFDYLIGLAVFGIFYAMWNGILVEMQTISSTSIVFDFVNMIWTGALVMYLVLGPFWLFNRIRELRR
jgi:hypothetical protein